MEQTIYKKLIKVQQEIGAIAKDSENPFFKSNYFDINALLSEVKPVMNTNGLIVIQPLQSNELGNILETIIIDSESGETIKSSVSLPDNPDPQKMGSIITYFRRYALQSMLGLQAEDEDGNSGNSPAKTYKKTETKTPTPKTAPTGKIVPTCNLCNKPMSYSEAKNTFYCKHPNNVWGKPVFPDNRPEPVKKFEKELDASMYGG